MRSDLQAVFLYTAPGQAGGGLVSQGEFDSFSGGGISVDGKMYYPPGSQFPVNRGGKAEIAEAELGREWQPDRDDVLYRFLKDRPNFPCRITRHVRNPDLSIVLTPFAIYDGLLSALDAPEYDGQSADDSMLTLSVMPSGGIG